MQTSPTISNTRKRLVFVYSMVMLAITFCAELFTQHHFIWMLLMIASIPIFAAIVGGWPERGRADKD